MRCDTRLRPRSGMRLTSKPGRAALPPPVKNRFCSRTGEGGHCALPQDVEALRRLTADNAAQKQSLDRFESRLNARMEAGGGHRSRKTPDGDVAPGQHAA